MAYIDADKLITFANNHKNKMIDANDIARFPTADVVPKSEVVKIFEKIEKDGKYVISFVENHKAYSEEVRQAKLECYKDIQNYIAELKKKYTESEGER